jgi:hypothetical protein
VTSEDDLERLVREQARPGDMVVPARLRISGGVATRKERRTIRTVAAWAAPRPRSPTGRRLMPISLLLAGLWILVALGTNDLPASWALIVAGIPLLGVVTMQLGPVAGLAGLVVGALLIRRPRREATGPVGNDR